VLYPVPHAEVTTVLAIQDPELAGIADKDMGTVRAITMLLGIIASNQYLLANEAIYLKGMASFIAGVCKNRNNP
jgi:hypothetical protein